MKVDVSFERSQTAPVELAKGLSLFDDLEANIKLFPKLARLDKLDERTFQWTLEPLGTAGISHVVSFATRFEVDRAAGRVRWSPVAGKGNATMEGQWTLVARGSSTQFTLRTSGTLDKIEAPFVLRPAVGPFVKAQFGALVERYLEKTLRSVGA